MDFTSLKKIFEKIMDISVSDDEFLNLTRQSLASWDSMNHFQLLITLQSGQKKKLSFSEIEKLNSVKGIIEIMQVK